MTIPMHPPARMSSTERERRSRIGYFFATLGVGWLLGTLALDLALHAFDRPELPRHLVYVSLSVGAVVGWWGFFWALPKRAKDGGTWVIDASERLHMHRRATDPAPEPAPEATAGLRAVTTAVDPERPIGAQVEGEGD